ncbi:MAG: NAD(P)/FAD-dependent oxidoreductase [Cyanobacteria bacterium J06641_5]
MRPTPNSQTTHSTEPTLVLGGGFTGLFAALSLSRKQYSRSVTLIDRQERFTFQPLLYELLSGETISYQANPRYRDLLAKSQVQFLQDTVETIDLDRKCVQLQSGQSCNYGNLVLALGSTVNYFGIPGAQEQALPFRTADHARRVSQILRERLREASETVAPDRRQALLTFAIAGAGPAGVELGVTLADLVPGWYAGLGGNPAEIRIVMLELQDTILPGPMTEALRKLATEALTKRSNPVELRLGTAVGAVTAEQITLKTPAGAEDLAAATLLWTAGAKVHPLVKELAIPAEKRDRGGRLQVSPTLQLLDYPEVFVGGDCAATEPSFPPLAQVAYQQGQTIANNLVALDKGEELEAAQVTLRGSLLKLGLGKSAANLFDRLAITGKPGYLIRLGTYLTLLPTPGHNLKALGGWMFDEVYIPLTERLRRNRKKTMSKS